MAIASAVNSDIHEAAQCLAAAFAEDPITGFVLQTGRGYAERLMRFFSLLMQARVALEMPVLLDTQAAGIRGVAMGYTSLRPTWPSSIAAEWEHFEKAIPGMSERLAVYEAIAEKYKPSAPHYYLGAIGVAPASQGLGIGNDLLKEFCDRSGSDELSHGVYLETARESNLAFYKRAGFVETGRGVLGSNTLWCMYLPHRPHEGHVARSGAPFAEQ
jgi:ribosomal protein S18 acetylase RimI-like enzyme